MSALIREALALGARFICPMGTALLDVQGKSGAWGHKNVDTWHVACPACWGYGDNHMDICEKKDGEAE